MLSQTITMTAIKLHVSNICVHTTRKATRHKGRENDTTVEHTNLFTASSDLDLSPPDPKS